jgi:hypothetical protein
VTYLLNPEGDLKFTEEKISNYFRTNFFWERINLEKSEADLIIHRLKQGYVYMWVQQLLRTRRRGKIPVLQTPEPD